jgi:two-component system NtrC family sensor kinase
MPTPTIDEKARLVEKIRVLNCLYQISELVVDGTNAFEKTLQAILDLIPQAFEYPEKVAAAILLGETVIKPQVIPHLKSAHKPIVVSGEVRGRLEIGFIEDGFLPVAQRALAP